jgi:hypothetical protein
MDMNALKLIVTFAVALTLLPGLVPAATGDSRLEGRLPDNTPVVSIDQPRGTVLDALSAIAKQMGWSLVVTAPEGTASRPLTIQVVKRPAADVLDMVLEAGSLRASFAGGVLRVHPDAAPAASQDLRRGGRREGRGRRGQDRVVIGQSLTIGPDETVDRAVAVGGSITVAGHVRRDVVAVGGSVTLTPGARVEGDAVAVGGLVSIEEGATLEGDHVSAGGTIPAMAGSLTRWAVSGRPHLHPLLGFVPRVMRALLIYAITLLIAASFPGALTRIRTYLVDRPGLSALGGIAIVLGFVPLCIALAVTIIGIPLIPVAMMLLVVLLLFGFAVSAGWLGERMPFLHEKTPVKTVAVGGVVLAIVGLVPWIGSLLLICAAAVSAGATLLSRFGRRMAIAV